MAAGKPGPVRVDNYRGALGKRDPIRSMAGAPDRIAKLLRGLDERALAKRPAPGEWSIKEVVAHLADGEFMVGSRIRLVAAMDRPTLVGYDQDAFVEKLALERASTAELFVAFAAARAANVALYRRLPKSSYARVGLHTERGEESLGGMLVMYAGHDLIHEAQLARVAAELGRARAAKRPARARR